MAAAAGADDAEEYDEKAERGHDLAEPQGAGRALLGQDVHGVELEDQVRDDDPEAAARDLCGDEHRRLKAGDRTEDALGERDDRVERRGHRPDRQDERHEDAAGDQGFLEQLQTDVVGTEGPGGYGRPT